MSTRWPALSRLGRRLTRYPSMARRFNPTGPAQRATGMATDALSRSPRSSPLRARGGSCSSRAPARRPSAATRTGARCFAPRFASTWHRRLCTTWVLRRRALSRSSGRPTRRCCGRGTRPPPTAETRTRPRRATTPTPAARCGRARASAIATRPTWRSAAPRAAPSAARRGVGAAEACTAATCTSASGARSRRAWRARTFVSATLSSSVGGRGRAGARRPRRGVATWSSWRGTRCGASIRRTRRTRRCSRSCCGWQGRRRCASPTWPRRGCGWATHSQTSTRTTASSVA
mmetsp:Transcript_8747/g.29046  ORF Transcript_8747/g.29046 Transcript_8747/m.29046 type:complete len:289 (+) Transcript_8747:330-1196(+)